MKTVQVETTIVKALADHFGGKWKYHPSPGGWFSIDDDQMIYRQATCSCESPCGHQVIYRYSAKPNEISTIINIIYKHHI